MDSLLQAISDDLPPRYSRQASREQSPPTSESCSPSIDKRTAGDDRIRAANSEDDPSLPSPPESLRDPSRSAEASARNPSALRSSASTDSNSLPIDSLQLTVVQQPVRGRVSGISSSDRRPIHPPPILKLSGKGPADAASHVLFVSLWTPNLQQNMTYSTKTSDPVVRYKLNSDKNEPSLEEGPASKRAKYTVSTTTAYINNQVLLGQLVAISTPLMDLDHERGFFFIYPELSVRTSGKLRLRFDLFEMVAGASGKRSPLATCFSDVFQVYNPKEYPGITQSTALTACFARQGIKMRVRSGDERKRRAEDDSEDD